MNINKKAVIKAKKRAKKRLKEIGLLNIWRLYARKAYKHIRIDKKVASYIESLAMSALPASLRNLFQSTEVFHNHEMQIDQSEASFLAMILRLMGARDVLEIGTFRGWSTAVLANTLHDIHGAGNSGNYGVTTIELRKVQADDARALWQEHVPHIADNITLIEGDASIVLDTLQSKGNTYDLVFIDADKSQYEVYMQKADSLLRIGGIIMLDNMLNAGLVATSAHDKTTNTLRQLNTLIFNGEHFVIGQSEYSASLIPAWDGVVILKKSETVNN